MAFESTENSSSFNFNIEDTSYGSKELLDALYESETDDDGLEPVNKDKDKSPKKEEKPKEEPKKEEPKKEKPKEEEKPDPIDTLLGEEEEEEETDPKDEEEKKDEEEEDEDTGKVNQFEAFAKDLFELGAFSKDEDEGDVQITTPEQFLERFDYEKKKGANEIVSNFIGQFGEDYQQAFEAIYVKGVNPKEYFTTYNRIENLSELDLTQESNQERVVKQSLIDQGYSEQVVQAKLEKIKNYGDLPEEAQHAHEILVKKEAKKLQDLEQNAEQERLMKAQQREQYITNVNTTLESKLKTSEFDGIPINSGLAREVQDFLLNEKYKTKSGETLTEFDKRILDLKRPENHSLKVKVALLLKIIEKDPTLSTIQKAGVTKKTNTLFQEVARQSSKSSTKSDKPAPKSGGSSWSKLL